MRGVKYKDQRCVQFVSLASVAKEVARVSRSFSGIDCALVNLNLYKRSGIGGTFKYTEAELRKIERTLDWFANEAEDEGTRKEKRKPFTFKVLRKHY